MHIFKLFFGVCIPDKENCCVRDLAYEHMDMTVHSDMQKNIIVTHLIIPEYTSLLFNLQ